MRPRYLDGGQRPWTAARRFNVEVLRTGAVDEAQAKTLQRFTPLEDGSRVVLFWSLVYKRGVQL